MEIEQQLFLFQEQASIFPKSYRGFGKVLAFYFGLEKIIVILSVA
jgi:hypothetical protein